MADGEGEAVAPQTDLDGFVRQISGQVGALFRRMIRVEAHAFGHDSTRVDEIGDAINEMAQRMARLAENVSRLASTEASNATLRLDDVMGISRRVDRIDEYTTSAVRRIHELEHAMAEKQNSVAPEAIAIQTVCAIAPREHEKLLEIRDKADAVVAANRFRYSAPDVFAKSLVDLQEVLFP